MRFLNNLFGSKTLKVNDSSFGEIESFRIRGSDVGWQFKKNFLNSNIDILIGGNKEGISNNQKRILLEALKNETEIKSESEKALKEQYTNAEMNFLSIERHFELNGISVMEEGFEMQFQEKEGQNYFFNVHFKNNKQIGVSIDG